MASTAPPVRLATAPPLKNLPAAFDVIERHGVVRPAVSEAQLQSFAKTLNAEVEDKAPEPPAPAHAAPAALDVKVEDTNYPLMAALFRDDQKRRKSALSAQDEWNKAVEGRRGEWERWLRDVYASGDCVRSRAFAAFLLRATFAADDAGAATKAAVVAARKRRLLAEADALTAQKTRDELERRLRTREAEVAGATGGLEVQASRCEQALAALVSRRDALSAFAKARDASLNARTEAQASQEATRERLRGELAAAEAAESIASQELANSRAAEDADAAAARAHQAARERLAAERAADDRVADDQLRFLQETARRRKRAVAARHADAQAATDEAGIAEAALRSMEEEVLPYDRRGVARAVEKRKTAERAAADHRRAAAASLCRLEAEADVRRDESEAVAALGPLLHPLDEDAPPPPPEHGALAAQARQAVAEVDGLLRGARWEAKARGAQLADASKNACAEEAALQRVLDSSLKRRDGLQRAARDARREATGCIAAHKTAFADSAVAAAEEADARSARTAAAAALADADAAAEAKSSPRHRRRDSVGDASAHQRREETCERLRDALASSDGGDVEGVLADDPPPLAVEVAREELERVEAVIVLHESDRDHLRGEVSKLQHEWGEESAGLRVSLRGVEAQVKSHSDDARAATATHDALLAPATDVSSVSSPP